MLHNDLVNVLNGVLELELRSSLPHCSIARSITRSLPRSLDRSLDPSIARWLARSFAPPLVRSLDCSLDRSLAQLLARSLDHSIAHLLGHSIARSHIITQICHVGERYTQHYTTSHKLTATFTNVFKLHIEYINIKHNYAQLHIRTHTHFTQHYTQ